MLSSNNNESPCSVEKAAASTSKTGRTSRQNSVEAQRADRWIVSAIGNATEGNLPA